MFTTHRADCLAAAAHTVDFLLTLANQDQHGVYWDSIPRSMSTAANTAMELSLQTGTSGILLFLSEYYRQTRDSRLQDILPRVVSWLRAKSNGAPIRSGFYCGYPGAMYAIAAAENLLGGPPTAGPADAWRSLLSTKRYDLASLADGVAGTLLALECLHELGVKDTPLDLAPKFVRNLMAQTRLTREGAYWGRHPRSIRPSTSFVHGSTGVEYLLARYASGATPAAAAWLAVAGMRQDNAHFDAAAGNWPDFLNEEHFQQPSMAERLRVAAQRGEQAVFAVNGDSIGWGNGTSGVLLARLAWAAQPGNHEIGIDLARAMDRIVRDVSSAAFPNGDFSLYGGWAGIGLVAAHAAAVSQDPRFGGIVGAIGAACIEYHRANGNFNPPADGSSSHLSLLRGVTGVAYFLLKASAGDNVASILAPLGAQMASRSLPLSEGEAAQAIAGAVLPRTVQAAGKAVPVTAPERLTLDNFLACVRSALRECPERADDAMAYEGAILQAEAEQDCYNYLAWTRCNRMDDFRSNPRFTNDKLLLNETVALRPDVKLGRVLSRHRQAAPEGKPDAAPDLVLLVPEFCGIVEHKLPQDTYAVLSQLKRPLRVRALCQIVHAKYPSLVGPKGIEFVVLRAVRGALAAGAIHASPPGPLRRVLDVVFGDKIA